MPSAGALPPCGSRTMGEDCCARAIVLETTPAAHTIPTCLRVIVFKILAPYPPLRRHGIRLAGIELQVGDDLGDLARPHAVIQSDVQKSEPRRTGSEAPSSTGEQALAGWEGISAVPPWLFAIMHNLFVSRWRTVRRRRETMSGDEVAVGPEQAGALTRRDLLAGLDRLTEEQRQMLLLIRVEERPDLVTRFETAGPLVSSRFCAQPPHQPCAHTGSAMLGR